MKNNKIRDVVMNWDLSRVHLYLVNRKNMLDGKVGQLILEYRRFIILTLENPGELIPIAGPVDDVWHTHVLFTKDYVAFGMAAVGGYIHHNPTASDDEAKDLSEAYTSNTFRIYEQEFGPIDREVWGANFQVCLCNGVSALVEEIPHQKIEVPVS